MGYTHYWDGTASADAELRGKIEKLISNSNVPVSYEYDDQRKPLVSEEAVRFNGVGKDGHETFMIMFDHPTAFDFCKTARKPYDVLVVAILILLEEANGGTFSWRSDGDTEDHAEGRALARSVS